MHNMSDKLEKNNREQLIEEEITLILLLKKEIICVIHSLIPLLYYLKPICIH